MIDVKVYYIIYISYSMYISVLNISINTMTLISLEVKKLLMVIYIRVCKCDYRTSILDYVKYITNNSTNTKNCDTLLLLLNYV